MPSSYASDIALSLDCLLAACADAQADEPTETWVWDLVPTLATESR